MKKKGKILIWIAASVIGLAAAYTAVWHGLYHFKWKNHITGDLSYMKELSDGTPYYMYETSVGTDNYDLFVPRFPYMSMYGAFASAQDIGGKPPFNPNGLDMDIMGNVFLDPLKDSIKNYVFFVSSYETTEQYQANQNYAFVLDPDGNLTNQDELSDSALALYDHARETLDDIIRNEKVFFNLPS